MRICVLGNSFVGALKNGWEAGLAAEFPSTELIFFASPQNRLATLSISGRELISADKTVQEHLAFTSGGHRTIEIDSFDAFLVYGLQFEFRSTSLPSGLTDAVLRATLRDRYLRTANCHVARLVRSLSTAPLLASPVPLRAEPVQDGFDHGPHSYDDLIALTNQEFASESILFVGQPSETLTPDWQTKPEFTKGSLRLAVNDELVVEPHPSSDVGHMNGDFGAKFIRELLPVVIGYGTQ